MSATLAGVVNTVVDKQPGARTLGGRATYPQLLQHSAGHDPATTGGGGGRGDYASTWATPRWSIWAMPWRDPGPSTIARGKPREGLHVAQIAAKPNVPNSH